MSHEAILEKKKSADVKEEPKPILPETEVVKEEPKSTKGKK